MLLVAPKVPGIYAESQPAIPFVTFLTNMVSSLRFWMGVSNYSSVPPVVIITRDQCLRLSNVLRKAAQARTKAIFVKKVKPKTTDKTSRIHSISQSENKVLDEVITLQTKQQCPSLSKQTATKTGTEEIIWFD